MKLFAYYAFHSFINSLRKLFKTWIAVFIAIFFVIGLLGGMIGAALDKQESPEPVSTEAVSTVPDTQTDDGSGTGFLAEHGITPLQMTEGIISLVFLVIVFFTLLNTDSASKIFKPADVALLFPSPMKPQSVMMFRLIGSLGLMLFASVYMIGQIPNLVVNVGFSVWGACSLLIAWAYSLISSTLFQVTLYTVSSRHPVFKANMSRIVAGVFALIVAGFIVFTRTHDGDIIHSAAEYFASPATRIIPFWGWLRGFCVGAIGGNSLSCAVYGLLLLVGSAGLIALIWNLDADFYEDALESTEKMSELLEKSKNGTATSRKKDRSDKLERDGMKHGFGANVFFWKSMYNRSRFAILHMFTKTFLVYLAIALVGSYFCRQITDFNDFIIVACIMSLVAFYRTLGNPLQEDTSKEFFVMIPETAGIKLLWSLLAGGVNCLLDVVIPIAVSAVWLKAGFATAIMWTLFIVSIDFFGTTVGAFIGLSVPVNAGRSLKQMVQIMFIYFGIAPAAVLVIVGIATEQVVLFMLLAIALNLLAGAVFFVLTPHFLENGNR